MELDHLYRETTRWDRSVGFWESLGFSFAEQWGSAPHRAGRMVNGEASVVLAEVATNNPTASVFLTTSDVDTLAAAVGMPVVDTHWGTRMVSVTDPDGRTYNFEPKER